MKIPCKNCNKLIDSRSISGLCIECRRDKEAKDKIDLWKRTGNTGCSVNTTLKNCIRTYILEKQDNKCKICGLPTIWNNKQLNLILDHIDGDASNNYEDNLRLICPNCDSQLDTYKSKNKNSARLNRK